MSSGRNVAGSINLIPQNIDLNWLKDYKNRPPRGDEKYLNDYKIVQGLKSGEKLMLTSHEASKVSKQADLLVKYKDVYPEGLVKYLASMLDNAYTDTGKKLLDRRRLPGVQLPGAEKAKAEQKAAAEVKARAARERAAERRPQLCDDCPRGCVSASD